MTKFSYALLVLLLLSFICKAQKPQNDGGDVDYQNLHFGFAFQYIQSEYKIYRNENWQDTYRDAELKYYPSDGAQLWSIQAERTPGFGLGFVSDLKLGSHANLRLTPMLTFGDRKITYTYQNTPEKIYTTQSKANFVEVPLGLKLKSDQIGNFRAYILGGVKYSNDIKSSANSNKDIDAEMQKHILFKPKYFSWETGIGFDLYFEFFKMSPEIKFSQSFGNVLNTNEPVNVYSLPIDKLFLRSFQFSLFFE